MELGKSYLTWTWLPPLRKRLAKVRRQVFQCREGIRDPAADALGVRYEDSFEKAYPFDRLVEGMMAPEMVLETVDIVKCCHRERNVGKPHHQ